MRELPNVGGMNELDASLVLDFLCVTSMAGLAADDGHTLLVWCDASCCEFRYC